MASSSDARKGYMQRAGANIARSQGARSMSKDGVNASVEIPKQLNRGDSKEGSLVKFDPKQLSNRGGYRTPDTHKSKMDMQR